MENTLFVTADKVAKDIGKGIIRKRKNGDLGQRERRLSGNRVSARNRQLRWICYLKILLRFIRKI